jgi:hypothetical protein
MRPVATNILQVTATFSNATSRSLNILDAADGHSAYLVEPDPKLGRRYYPLTRLANSLKLNLVPSATFADCFRITNPPPRFRLVVGIREPPEKGLVSGIKSNLVSSPLAEALADEGLIKPPAPPPNGSRLPPAISVWIDSKPPDPPLPPPVQTNAVPLPRK